MPTSQPLNPPNEFPDIVGAPPVNPILASFRPFIPPHARLRELTPLPLIIGTLLGMVFGASSLYLVLKVGLTVSASIPVAVISITVFRVLSKIPGMLRKILAGIFLLAGIFGLYVTLTSVTTLFWKAIFVLITIAATGLFIWIVLFAEDATILENNIVQTAG